MKKRIWITRVVVISFLVLFMGYGSANAVSLSNTQVTGPQIGLLFDSGSAVTMTSNFDFVPPTPGGDGVVLSGYAPGIAGTAAEGSYFYFYGIHVNSGANPPTVSQIAFVFLGLETGLDIDGDSSPDTSVHILSSGGTVAPTAANYFYGHEIAFPFIDPVTFGPTLNAGDTSYLFGAVSPLEPGIVTAGLLNTAYAAPADVYAPVPEPGSLLLLGTGLIGLGFARRKFRGNKRV